MGPAMLVKRHPLSVKVVKDRRRRKMGMRARVGVWVGVWGRAWRILDFVDVEADMG